MPLHPETLLLGYEYGYFPMAQSRDDTELFWFNPDPRAIVPLDAFHLSRSLKKAIRKQPFRLTVNQAFREVMQGCAEPRRAEGESWINAEIIELYHTLYEWGDAHSLECWDAKGRLVGGLYGVSRGAAFFGESMFSRQSNASKIAVAYLLEILLRAGYTLLDTQFINEHLLQFGVVEIPRKDYLERLRNALIASPNPSRRFSSMASNVLSLPPASLMVMAPEVSSRTS